MYDWNFEPDAADVAKNQGYNLGVHGGEAYKTESQAIWHGKRWMKECHRTGTITAVSADAHSPIYIMDY